MTTWPRDRRKDTRALYRDTDGYLIPREEERAIRAVKSNPLYGELTPTGTHRMLEYLDMGPDDTFYDLGSGTGKVVMQTAMSVPLKRCTGIELSAARCRDAKRVLRQARERHLIVAKSCSFRCQDLLEANLGGATVIYTCSTAFSMRFMNELVRKLRGLPRSFTFLTLQEPMTSTALHEQKVLSLDTTWKRRVPVWVYRVNE